MENKVFVNDIIVIDTHKTGYNYNFYSDFFDIYDLEPEMKENFGDSLVDHVNRDNNKEDYKCLFTAPNIKNNFETTLYVIQGLQSKKVFLIDEKVIYSYYHTTYSYDNTDTIIYKLIRYIKGLQEQVNSNGVEIYELKMKMESLLKENNTLKNKSKSEPMPSPETGMFGIIKHLDSNTYVPFCVVNDIIVYATEAWDDVKTFDIYGKSEYSEIVCLYKGVKSFDGAMTLFNKERKQQRAEQLIWRSSDYEIDCLCNT